MFFNVLYNFDRVICGWCNEQKVCVPRNTEKDKTQAICKESCNEKLTDIEECASLSIKKFGEDLNAVIIKNIRILTSKYLNLCQQILKENIILDLIMICIKDHIDFNIRLIF